MRRHSRHGSAKAKSSFPNRKNSIEMVICDGNELNAQHISLELNVNPASIRKGLGQAFLYRNHLMEVFNYRVILPSSTCIRRRWQICHCSPSRWFACLLGGKREDKRHHSPLLLNEYQSFERSIEMLMALMSTEPEVRVLICLPSASNKQLCSDWRATRFTVPLLPISLLATAINSRSSHARKGL